MIDGLTGGVPALPGLQPEPDRPGLVHEFRHLLVLPSWAGHVISVSLSFLIINSTCLAGLGEDYLKWRIYHDIWHTVAVPGRSLLLLFPLRLLVYVNYLLRPRVPLQESCKC